MNIVFINQLGILWGYKSITIKWNFAVGGYADRQMAFKSTFFDLGDMFYLRFKMARGLRAIWTKQINVDFLAHLNQFQEIGIRPHNHAGSAFRYILHFKLIHRNARKFELRSMVGKTVGPWFSPSFSICHRVAIPPKGFQIAPFSSNL